MFLFESSQQGGAVHGKQSGATPFDPAASSATARLMSRAESDEGSEGERSNAQGANYRAMLIG